MKASSWGPGGSSGRRPSFPAPWHWSSWLQHGGPVEADEKGSDLDLSGYALLCQTRRQLLGGKITFQLDSLALFPGFGWIVTIC